MIKNREIIYYRIVGDSIHKSTLHDKYAYKFMEDEFSRLGNSENSDPIFRITSKKVCNTVLEELMLDVLDNKLPVNNIRVEFYFCGDWHNEREMNDMVDSIGAI